MFYGVNKSNKEGIFTLISNTRVVQKVQGAPYKIKLSLHCYEHGIKCIDATLGALMLYYINLLTTFTLPHQV